MNARKYACMPMIVFLVFILMMASCANNDDLTVGDDLILDEVELTEDYFEYEEDCTLEDSLRHEDITIITHNSITGTIILIEGVNDESWIAPEHIDWLSLKIKCDDGEQVLIIALQHTVRHGEIKIGNRITVYWPVESLVFVCDIPIYVAYVIVEDGIMCDTESEQSIWQRYMDTNETFYLWSYNPIKDFTFPRVYSSDMFEVLQLPIVAYGELLEEWPIILEDGTIMVPLQSVIGNSARSWITFEHNVFDDGSLFINVQCGSMVGIRHLAVGSIEVVMSGDQRQMCTAPMIVEGIVYVPLLSFFRDMRPFGNTSAEIFDDRIEIFLE